MAFSQEPEKADTVPIDEPLTHTEYVTSAFSASKPHMEAKGGPELSNSRQNWSQNEFAPLLTTWLNDELEKRHSGWSVLRRGSPRDPSRDGGTADGHLNGEVDFRSSRRYDWLC